MARKLRRRELDSPEEITKNEEVVIENEPISIDKALFVPEPEVEEEPVITVTVQEEDIEDLDEKFGVAFEEEVKEIVKAEMPKQQRSIGSLSRAQLRIFERTGKLPN